MKFPNKPAFFDLNELEYRLLAPRLAFQKLMQVPRGKQLKINGNIVNVPAGVPNSVSLLPQLPNEACTTTVKLKRKLQYKSSVLSLIRSTELAITSLISKKRAVVDNFIIIIKFSTTLRSLDMRLVIANSALRATLAIYHLISNAC